MKITFFMLADLATGRGTENVLFNLLKYKPVDLEVEVVTPIDNDGIRINVSEIKSKLNNANLIRMNLRVNNDSSGLKSLLQKVLIKPVRNELKKYMNSEILNKIRETDIVYLFYNPYSVFFYNTRIPIIGSNHTDNLNIYNQQRNFLKNLYYKLIYKWYYTNINGLHVFPKNKHILNNTNFKYRMVLPNGVDTSLFYPDHNSYNKKLKLVFVAALTENKGLDILLPLIDRFTNADNLEFHIAGSGPMINEIKKRKNTIYHSVVNDRELSELYRNSDVFVYPSHSDTYSLVTLEALSSGLYVLCSEYLKGNFDEFENKYLEYLPLNIDLWYTKIVNIMNNRELIKHDKEAEYDYIKENYDWKEISNKFYDCMEKFYKESIIK